ncbi:hypothetical protein [Streptomyces sp. NBC_00576]|uniref:hypothetical protein n=1 Tax=Streptomyces sp. NBC_00576 TaxID=2903665 RepID=UPI002E80ED2F|nr:hypothetical protein [Streptomyces sp. NBC_00576]WUB71389.1 hypothetical protein OG734_15500 [Streptomyces sp. NBC_00576]
MLFNLILRALPFYIREPLVIAICLFFCGISFYWTIQVGGWARFGFGVLFLAVAVLRGFMFRGELRSRRAAIRAAAEAPTTADHHG